VLQCSKEILHLVDRSQEQKTKTPNQKIYSPNPRSVLMKTRNQSQKTQTLCTSEHTQTATLCVLTNTTKQNTHKQLHSNFKGSGAGAEERQEEMGVGAQPWVDSADIPLLC